MHKPSRPLTQITDEQLLLEVRSLVAREREATAQLVASLAELDRRKLYLGEGYSSLFTYCTQCLHLSDYVELNIIGLMLLSALCEAGGRIQRRL